MSFSEQIQVCFFLRKNFKQTKTCHKQKPTSKTKLSEQKTTWTTIFHVHTDLKLS